MTGSFVPSAWNQGGRETDVDDAKGLIELLARLLDAGSVGYQRLETEPLLHPGRSARVRAWAAEEGDANSGPVIDGVVGELHPRVLAEAGLRAERLIVAELSIAGLSGGSLPVRPAAPPPRFPSVERDLAVVAPERIEAGRLAGTIAGAAGPLLQDVRLFDVYRGRPLADDERSLAFRLRFAAADRTLTEAEVDGAIVAVVAAVEADGGRIRS
jgi:phenylalanyl-tRNA synthetase beta chain